MSREMGQGQERRGTRGGNEHKRAEMSRSEQRQVGVKAGTRETREARDARGGLELKKLVRTTPYRAQK